MLLQATCEKGHSFTAVFQDPPHSLMFERAIQRMVDEDWRDAVLDAYTALDMYLATVPIRLRYDTDPTIVPEDIKRLRKEMDPATGNATKAMGAALAVAAVVCRVPPMKISNKLQNLRNEAIHEGRYPTEEDATWAVFEVEKIISSFDDLLDTVSPNRQPTFRNARLLFEACGGVSLNGTRAEITIGGWGVLSGSYVPRETVVQRIGRYRSGELDLLRLY